MAMLAGSSDAMTMVLAALVLFTTRVQGFWDPAVGCANAPGPCAQATPWSSEEERLVRWAARPSLCLSPESGVRGRAPLLVVRPCNAWAPEQRLASPAAAEAGSLQLGGRCVTARSDGTFALGECAKGTAGQDFELPPSGYGRIVGAAPAKVGTTTFKVGGCLSVRGATVASPSLDVKDLLVELVECKGDASDQAFLLPRPGIAQSSFVGANLGGWLILESWMWPAEMESQGIIDEFSLIAKYGGPSDERAQSFMHKHWDSFVQPEHLDALKRFGITHVRIPLGYWLFDSVYHESDGFVAGAEPYLARVLGWLRQRGMKAVLDLHAMPGGQATEMSFTGRETNVAEFFHLAYNGARGGRAVQALVDLVLRYEATAETSGVVVGVELLNEPTFQYFSDTEAFYAEMIPMVRKSLPSDRYMVLIGFMDSPHSASAQWLAEKIRADPENYMGVVYDIHLYHLYGDNQSPWTKDQDYCKTCCRDKHMLEPVTSEGIPTIVGEYSIATGFWGWADDGFVQTNLENYLSVWNNTRSVVGSFMWNFRILVDPSNPMQYLEWSLVDMIGQGYLAPDFVFTADLSSECPAVAAANGGKLRCPNYSGVTIYWCTTCQWVDGPERRLSSGSSADAPLLLKLRGAGIDAGAAPSRFAAAAVAHTAGKIGEARLLV